MTHSGTVSAMAATYRHICLGRMLLRLRRCFDGFMRQVDAGGPVSGTHQKGYNKTGKRVVPTFNSEKASIASFRRGSPPKRPAQDSRARVPSPPSPLGFCLSARHHGTAFIATFLLALHMFSAARPPQIPGTQHMSRAFAAVRSLWGETASISAHSAKPRRSAII